MKSRSLAKGVFLLLLLPLFGCANSGVPTPPELLRASQRSPAADFSEQSIFGDDTVSLQNFRGEVVLLNFWATWCPPCRAETPSFRALQERYAGLVEVVGVSVFSYTTATEKFYHDYKVNYPMIYGSYDLMGEYGNVHTIPTTFVVDKRGRIAAKVVGSRTKEQYEAMIKPLLKE